MPRLKWFDDMLEQDSKLHSYLLLDAEGDDGFVDFKYAREGVGKFRLFAVSFRFFTALPPPPPHLAHL